MFFTSTINFFCQACDAYVLLEVYNILHSRAEAMGLSRSEMEPQTNLKLKSRMDKRKEKAAVAKKGQASQSSPQVKIWLLKYISPAHWKLFRGSGYIGYPWLKLNLPFKWTAFYFSLSSIKNWIFRRFRFFFLWSFKFSLFD